MDRRPWTVRDYTKILAWRKADDLTVAIYTATRVLPKEEVYALTSQIRRAAYSVPANIVEGSSRESKKDYLHFLYIARGSLSEAHYFVHLAGRLGYLAAERQATLLARTDEAHRLLAGLIRSVEAETGRVSRAAARIASALALGLAPLVVRSV